MRKLRFDIYSGFANDARYIEKDSFIQAEGDSLEDLAQLVYDRIIENGEQLLSDDEGDMEGEN